MDELFDSPISYIIIVLFVLALITLVIALQQLQRGRSNIYWRQRRAAGQRGGQMLLISLGLFGSAVVLAFFSGFASIALDRILNNDETPNSTTSTEIPLLAETTPDIESTVQFAVAATLTAQPTVANQPVTAANVDTVLIPTENPFEAFTAIQTTLTSDIVANSDSGISITAISNEITDQFMPQSPRTVFPSGTNRLYVFYDFNNVPDGIMWTRKLIYENATVYTRQELWSLDENGSSYIFVEADFPPGNYEFQVSLGDNLTNSYQFVIETQS